MATQAKCECLGATRLEKQSELCREYRSLESEQIKGEKKTELLRQRHSSFPKQAQHDFEPQTSIRTSPILSFCAQDRIQVLYITGAIDDTVYHGTLMRC